MYIKIQGTIVPVLILSVALHVIACIRSSVPVARATYSYKAQPAGLFRGKQRQVTETLVGKK
jgi:hypothetical protein